MRFKKDSIFFIFLFGLVLLTAQDDFVLKKIQIKGNHTISNSKLKRNLTLKAKNISHIILFWKTKPKFNEFYLEEDIKQIIVNYQKEGFLHVLVSAEKKILSKNKELILIFTIEENEPVITQSLNYLLNVETGEDETRFQKILHEHKTKWELKSGYKFRDDNVQSTRKQIYRLLHENGYPFPEVDFFLDLKNKNLNVDVTYQIDTGHYCDFGKISVAGNDKTPSNVILKQVSIQENEMFSQNEIEKTQRFVQQLGMFQVVTIRNRLTDIVDNKIPIEIFVQELPYWTIKTGIGYGLEERFRVTLNVKKLGFLGGARRADFYAKHSFLEPYHFSLKLIQPSFLNRQNTLSMNPFLRKEHETGYDLDRLGIILMLQQNVSASTHIFSNYKFERNFLEEKQTIRSELSNHYYNKSSISWGISSNNSEPPFYPDKGFYFSAVTTLSGLKFGSKFHYIQGLFDVRKYLQITDKSVLAMKGKLGMMKPVWGDEITPIEERFYAGGSSSIRGWGRGEIGPHNEDGVSVGGNSYLEGSLELRQRIYKIFYLVIFGDAGNVWQLHNQYDFNDLLYAGGLGIRIKTPLGPIRFDAAQPVWNNRKRIQLHISIGQAF
jgi:outer membrane protein insertion porin family